MLLSLFPQVCSSVTAVEEQLRGPETSLPCSGLSEATGSSSNTPEETDDVDNSSFNASYSMRAAPWAVATSSPPPSADEEGMLLAGGAMDADSSAEACASPEPPQDGKRGVSVLIHGHLCTLTPPVTYSFSPSFMHLVIQLSICQLTG